MRVYVERTCVLVSLATCSSRASSCGSGGMGGSGSGVRVHLQQHGEPQRRRGGGSEDGRPLLGHVARVGERALGRRTRRMHPNTPPPRASRDDQLRLVA